jgi:hypothetical protein
MIFCKSRGFLSETEDTLKSHVSFINTVFGVELERAGNDLLGMAWFVAVGEPHILYMSGHTGDAIRVLDCLHTMCIYGFGTSIQDVYLNTCSAKPFEPSNSPAAKSSSSSIIFMSEATEDEKKMLNIGQQSKFIMLDSVFNKVKDDSFKLHLCFQDDMVDEGVKMARFIPMDECGLGFSPTKSELSLFNCKGREC